MKVGISLPQAGSQATKENMLHMAQAAESEGIDSIWTFERLLWPTNPQTPYPATPDGSLPQEYQIMLDPLETLSFLAANTNKISLGTSVLDMLFHNPVILARRLATLDVFSEGRVISGLGIGWSKDEYQASNIPFNNKGKRADEYVKMLKMIWTHEDVEFKGQYYNIPKSKIGPKPVQKPHIPIYLGGFSPNAIKRIVENDLNGWIGIIGGIAPFDYVQSVVNNFRNEVNKANKDANKFKMILLAYPYLKDNSLNSGNNANRDTLTGTIDEIGDDIMKIKDLNVDHIIFAYNFSPIGKDIDKMIDLTKQFSQFAR
ncbi:TIGR03619 family F420-dependent LLM class oxidoreductase [Candidatus Nitrosocosmicus franklandus]|uniref:F420-dependent glucose-6-phosphate dehydrogenase n=1 Tax=Candidatus Nitrosocosmicus franklandianus TaxID=1798806 RepID=A0A484I9U1_9ARCH|nr:TIGR03619 family F420-dependent LLM class oxidoreductase [Candidatus Nitrosocosmicus franklandus]VFJ13533.1 F420-dependent glucose-6-phosphate dehydrogenase [Candidatus Nitrosocosmicus franklandus]